MDIGLKDIIIKKLWFEDDTNITEQMDNMKVMGWNSALAQVFFISMKNNDYLIRSHKKFARKLKNYQEDYLKYEFTYTVIKGEPNLRLCCASKY